MLNVSRIKELAREALACGADPHLAQKIILSSVDSPVILEKRLAALLDTVPDDADRERLAQMAWGPSRGG